MSRYLFVLAWALAGQVAGENRYSDPPLGDAAATRQSPPVGSSRRTVSPPPPITTPITTPIGTTPTTPQDYGYETPSGRPGTPAVRTKNDAAKTDVKPSITMRAMLTAPTGSRITGRPVRLAEALLGASTRQEQTQRIDAYWDLCATVADYYLGVREQDELQQLRSSVASVGPVWQQAESELGVRIGTSQRAAVASQYRLAGLMGSADATSLPLPADLPHCGDYYARYDQVFAGRQSAEAQQLSELLPMRYEELVGATLAVTRAEDFLNAIAAQRGGTGDGTGTLRALELLALRRRAFVQIARDYNERIARYTELASPGSIDADRLIGMLIRRDEAANTATRPGSLVPPPNRQSQVPPVDPAQTFAEGWESMQHTSTAAGDDSLKDEAVRPASAESKAARPPVSQPRISQPRREHSLLVPSE
jgi:hypothetical protein